MAQGIRSIGSCSIDSCERPAKSRGWCAAHYQIWYTRGHPLAPSTRIKRDDPSRPQCLADGCSTPFFAKGLCSAHYQRQYLKGALENPCAGCGKELRGRGSHRYCDDGCRPVCSINGCTSPALKQAETLCNGHDAQRVRYGVARPFAFRWGEAAPCKVCGASTDHFRLRSFCTLGCYLLWRRYGPNFLTTKPCLSCGDPIDLMERGPSGQRKHRVVVFCKPCGNRRTKYDGVTVRTLAQRDGTNCALCGESIDMELRRNHEGGFMCASVDHIIPQSHGGTHDPGNLQLTHLMCNLLKSDRIPKPLKPK